MGEEREIVEDEGITYEIREVTMPDGSRGGLACVPGSFDHLSDEEIVAKTLAVLPTRADDT